MNSTKFTNSGMLKIWNYYKSLILRLKMTIYKSHLKQTETSDKLTESEGHYRSLFFQSPTPMWILDMETTNFLQVNQAAITNYGYTEDEFYKMSIIDVKVEEGRKSVFDYIQRSKDTVIPQKLYTRHKRKSDEIFHVEVIFNTIPFEGKSAVLAITNDLTERMNHLESIQTQNEKLRQIAWIQCHQVRAPVASILGLTQLYEHDLPNEQVIEIMQGIKEAANKLDKVIRDTVDTAKTST
jgi:PAS domain S-box-containing protein